MRLWPTKQRQTDGGLDGFGGWDSAAPPFWSLTDPTQFANPWSPRLVDRVWVANRCMQLCAQQVASMPLRFYGAPSASSPQWVASPDPTWYPNGIGDAVFSAVWSQLGWGDSYLYVTNRYANGYPATWTVLDPATMSVHIEQGERVYRAAQVELDPEDVVQISRNPHGKLTGTSALSAYSTQLWATVAAGELGRAMVSGGGVPNAVLKSKRKLTGDQAAMLQTQWMAARSRSAVGAPAVLPPEIDFEQLSFNAEDVALLALQEFDAKAIASAFSVPAMMLNLELRGSLTYQNPEQLFEVWWRSELRPLAGRIQRALSERMLPAGSWVEFDARAALAPTFQDQVTAWTQLVKDGIVTTDEMRAAILKLPPLDEGPALDDLTEPPTASASPAAATSESAIVTELRPTGMVTA